MISLQNIASDDVIFQFKLFPQFVHARYPVVFHRAGHTTKACGNVKLFLGRHAFANWPPSNGGNNGSGIATDLHHNNNNNDISTTPTNHHSNGHGNRISESDSWSSFSQTRHARRTFDQPQPQQQQEQKLCPNDTDDDNDVFFTAPSSPV